jgi:hypothetical protein
MICENEWSIGTGQYDISPVFKGAGQGPWNAARNRPVQRGRAVERHGKVPICIKPHPCTIDASQECYMLKLDSRVQDCFRSRS